MSDIRIYTQPSTVLVDDCMCCPNSFRYEGSWNAELLGCRVLKHSLGDYGGEHPIPEDCPLPAHTPVQPDSAVEAMQEAERMGA